MTGSNCRTGLWAGHGVGSPGQGQVFGTESEICNKVQEGGLRLFPAMLLANKKKA